MFCGRNIVKTKMRQTTTTDLGSKSKPYEKFVKVLTAAKDLSSVLS